jgi:N-acetylglucosaminylphosphatidylinositol deacetylase
VSSVTSSSSSLKNDKTHHGGAVVISYRMLQPSLNWKAMAAHHSQFVWYRRLFVVFSIYTYVNRLRRMDDEEEILPARKHD